MESWSVPLKILMKLTTQGSIRRRHLLQESCFSLISTKTWSWNGFWSIQRALWPWQTWKYHRPLLAIKSDNLKNSVIRITWKPLKSGLKLKIQLLAEFCHPLCDMKFTDANEKSESLVFQTNKTKEPKTQGTESGPCLQFYIKINCVQWRSDWVAWVDNVQGPQS